MGGLNERGVDSKSCSARTDENQGLGSYHPSDAAEVAKKFPDKKESSQIWENSVVLFRHLRRV